MQLIIAHDQLHVQHKDISCSVYENYEPAEIDWLITAIELWAGAHFKQKYLLEKERWGVSKEAPILKYCITEWPNYLNSRIVSRRPILSLQDLCRTTIQTTLGTRQEFQLYKHLLTPCPNQGNQENPKNHADVYKKEKEPRINSG